ncbi:hypothetical protein [Aurantiacibacter gangjinensis]|uniref:Uncharacterized protein n=1 Tax=Aurantiacibacter gangjinensis TaxID=502682 RepID=A0A0G9MQJ5_9SPHN|nr:hypothetical protein [Aurantiacibacter gangjinensis]APE28871.1 Glycine-rich cell wall structural protein precursor [Aurantiacibacter gangjinensis]KLE33006.1 hypothetical protein AAW01_03100 [Aurantiacibacter gangjinensis]
MRRLSLTATFAMAAMLLPSHALAQAGGPERDDETERSEGRSGTLIAPYLEAAQVVTAQFEPLDDVVTYTQLAAGVDAFASGRYSQGSVSVRYERRIGYGDSVDADTISGIARGSLALARNSVTLEAGALAARTRVEGNGFASIGAFGADDDATSQIYSIYAGPSVQTREGPVQISGSYQLGYTRVESPDALVLAPGEEPVDIFDESTTHRLGARVGLAPNTVAPVGLGVGVGWNRQDISNLDQRVDDRFVRADVTVPVSPTLALVGGVGYEDVEVSNRDVLRDVNGEPVRGDDGRFVTDDSAPRTLSYDTDGLIWDAGVMWRPSRRTSLTAVVGRRYGSTTYYGTFSYAPSPNSSLGVNVYDNINAFGGQLTGAIADLGTDFVGVRNPISGDLGGCVIGTDGDNNCALARLSSLRSAVFRNRGVAASYALSRGRTSFGFGAGYDRRSFLGGADTILADVDGTIDETFYLAGNVARELDRQSSLFLGASASWYDTEGDLGDGMGYSASLAYNRNIWRGLTGTAAVGLDGISRDLLPDYTAASALLGLRYTFD